MPTQRRRSPGRSTSRDTRRRGRCGRGTRSARSDVARGIPFEQPPARDQHPADRAHDRVEAEDRPRRAGRRAQAAPARHCRRAARATAARCCRSGISSGLSTRSESAAMQDGNRRIADARPASRATRGDSTVQPSSNSAVSAAGTRLRRRLSKIFQRDSADSGLRSRRRSGPGTWRRSHPASCQSPRIQRCRRADVGAVAGRIFLVQLDVAQQAGARVATLEQIVAQDAVRRESVRRARARTRRRRRCPCR